MSSGYIPGPNGICLCDECQGTRTGSLRAAKRSAPGTLLAPYVLNAMATDTVASAPDEPSFVKAAAALPVSASAPSALDNSALRKQAPLAAGCFDYFPDALWAVAELSYWGNEKHNPGEPLHDARGKSTDDADCLLRHFKDRGEFDFITLKDGRVVTVRHSAAVAWRALRLLQREIEEQEGVPAARGAQL